ncbi:hypothetical protein [Sphingobium baderi]|uniref:hypothetical protein n=1 Tax=Sphingobium baderi TaxID=1332080 RepID=UPI000401D073|nr:hypothetical protein [Sphingobium baderi]
MFGWWEKRRREQAERRAFEQRMLDHLLLSIPKELNTQPGAISSLPTSISSVSMPLFRSQND